MLMNTDSCPLSSPNTNYHNPALIKKQSAKLDLNDIHQNITTAEQILAQKIIDLIGSTLAFKMWMSPYILLKKQKIKTFIMDSHSSESKYLLDILDANKAKLFRRPDLFFACCALVVEVDGDSHNDEKNSLKDSHREHGYKSIGCDVWVFEAHEIHNPARLHTIAVQIIEYIRKNKSDRLSQKYSEKLSKQKRRYRSANNTTSNPTYEDLEPKRRLTFLSQQCRIEHGGISITLEKGK